MLQPLEVFLFTKLPAKSLAKGRGLYNQPTPSALIPFIGGPESETSGPLLTHNGKTPAFGPWKYGSHPISKPWSGMLLPADACTGPKRPCNRRFCSGKSASAGVWKYWRPLRCPKHLWPAVKAAQLLRGRNPIGLSATSPDADCSDLLPNQTRVDDLPPLLPGGNPGRQYLATHRARKRQRRYRDSHCAKHQLPNKWRVGAGSPFTIRKFCRVCWNGAARFAPPSPSRWNFRFEAATTVSGYWPGSHAWGVVVRICLLAYGASLLAITLSCIPLRMTTRRY